MKLKHSIGSAFFLHKNTSNFPEKKELMKFPQYLCIILVDKSLTIL